MSSAQAISDGFSGCCGGTQLDSLSITGLSCAWAARATRAAQRTTARRGEVMGDVSGSVARSLWAARCAWVQRESPRANQPFDAPAVGSISAAAGAMAAPALKERRAAAEFLDPHGGRAGQRPGPG